MSRSAVRRVKCRMNDCIADSAGRLYTGSWFHDPSNEYELGKLMRVHTNGRVTVRDEGFHLANGLAFSPDFTALHFTDSAARRIFGYDYDANTGNVRDRRVVVQVPYDEGLPDGLTVDAEGFLWSAQWYGGCVVRYDPEGSVERRLTTPAKQASCVAFGGPDLADLCITSAARSEPMPVAPPVYDPDSGCFGGPLCRTRPGVQGRLQSKAKVCPRQ